MDWGGGGETERPDTGGITGSGSVCAQLHPSLFFLSVCPSLEEVGSSSVAMISVNCN